MKRFTGVGGIFFNARDPVALRAWSIGYRWDACYACCRTVQMEGS